MKKKTYKDCVVQIMNESGISNDSLSYHNFWIYERAADLYLKGEFLPEIILPANPFFADAPNNGI